MKKKKKHCQKEKRKVPIFMDCLICTWNFTPLGASFGIAKMCVSSHSGSIEQEHRWTHSQNLVTVPSFPQVYVMIPVRNHTVMHLLVLNLPDWLMWNFQNSILTPLCSVKECSKIQINMTTSEIQNILSLPEEAGDC